MKKDDNKSAQVEIDQLAKRSSKISRRQFTKTAAFAIPAISAFTVSRQALGQTGSGGGSGSGGGMMMMMMMR